MTRPGHVARWRRTVLRDRRIPDAPRVLALVLADLMDDRGYVTIDRGQLAELLGIYRSRADERLKVLRNADLLVRVQPPAPHRQAVWRLNFPVDVRGSRAPVEAGTFTPALPVHVGERRAPALPVRVNPADPSTVDTTCTGSTGARPIETPDQPDPWATGAHHLRTAAAHANCAATEGAGPA